MTYNPYKTSKFPDEIDYFVELADISPSQVPLVQEFQLLKLKESKTVEEQIRLNELTQILQNHIIDPQKWNNFCDAITNLELFFKNNVQDFIILKQIEMQNYIDSKTIDFDNKLNLFNHLGQYNSATQYKKWNVVTYNSETYLCLHDNINILPNPNGDTIYWAKIAARGEQGIQGIPGVNLNYRGNFNIATEYLKDDLVTYQNNTYACLLDTVNRYPDATGSEAYWVLFMTGNGETLSNLNTVDKTSLVNAINEVKVEVSDIAPTPTINKLWIDTN